ncbi:uncharacterized protein V2V93DRAFT_3422 [Kockiozyma suomiensis]|uniref:uncharacterized protein n=1 Tax=Kockiozyma suomiensis TaxID=1337062 RepID=UPI00334330A5
MTARKPQALLLGPFEDMFRPDNYNNPIAPVSADDSDSDDSGYAISVTPDKCVEYTVGGSSARGIRDRATTARLNTVLDHLAAVFPDTDVELLRQLMTDNRGPSQLAAIVELVLSSPALIRSRRRLRNNYVADWQRFRTREYRAAVSRVLHSHFKAYLHRSTVTNVLVQNNSSFTRALPILMDIATERTNRWTIMRLFRRHRSVVPFSALSWIGRTGCSELESELIQLDQPRLAELRDRDEQAARAVNEDEYSQAGQLIECECCFGEYAWEDLACCSDSHFFCRGCLENSVKEGVYGQGALRGKTVVPCISAAANPPCHAPVPQRILRASISEALCEEFEHAQVADFLAKNALIRGFVVCPFCDYAEESPAAVASSSLGDLRLSITFSSVMRFLAAGSLVFFLCLLPALALSLLYVLVSTIAQLLLSEKYYVQSFGALQRLYDEEIISIMRGVYRKRHGSAFVCKNPSCLRTSCTDCNKEFLPFHKCFEQEEDRMRVYIERAMADAVKRTCPVCRVSFIKSEGCNKLTCVCGYSMCYVCRKDIKQESYQHFCKHFRHIPGSACTECDRCDLYKVEDEAITIERAAKEAEAEFVQSNGFPSGLHMSGKVIGPGGHEAYDRRGLVRALESRFVAMLDAIIAE